MIFLQITTLPTGMPTWAVIFLASIVTLPPAITAILSFRSQKQVTKTNNAVAEISISKADKTLVDVLVNEIGELKEHRRACDDSLNTQKEYNIMLTSYLHSKGFDVPPFKS